MTSEIWADVQVVELKDQLVIKIFCSAASAGQWCTSINRLRNEEISSIHVRPMSAPSKGRFIFKQSGRSLGFAAIHKGNAETIIEMTKHHLGHLYSFLHHFEERGFGSVDHVDIEATISGERGRDAYITFHVPTAADPKTPDEADKWFRV